MEDLKEAVADITGNEEEETKDILQEDEASSDETKFYEAGRKETEPGIALEDAVHRIIEEENFAVLKNYTVFTRKLRAAPPEIRASDKDNKKLICEAIHQRFGTVVVKANRKAWDKARTRAALIQHQRMTKSTAQKRTAISIRFCWTSWIGIARNSIIR